MAGPIPRPSLASKPSKGAEKTPETDEGPSSQTEGMGKHLPNWSLDELSRGSDASKKDRELEL